jgi:hypothetical protein
MGRARTTHNKDVFFISGSASANRELCEGGGAGPVFGVVDDCVDDLQRERSGCLEDGFDTENIFDCGVLKGLRCC